MGKYDNMTDAEMRAELERRDSARNPYEKVVGWETTTDSTKLTARDGNQYDVWKGERYTEKGVSAIFLVKKSGGFMEYHIDQRWTKSGAKKPLVGIGCKDTVKAQAQVEYLQSPEFKADMVAMVKAQKAYLSKTKKPASKTTKKPRRKTKA